MFDTIEDRQAGFTLVELMVTVSCMLVLAAIAVPSYKNYILQTNLQQAKPYASEIAAKQRMYKVVNGVYCCSNYDGSSETSLITNLGLSIDDSGDFCYLFVCNSTSICASLSGGPSGFISGNPAGGSAPDFEIWAVLNDQAKDAAAPGSVTCKPGPNKSSPTGWVNASTTGLAGRTGQVVVFRYPPPPNGASTGADSFHAGVVMNWQAGFSISDALVR